MINKVTMISRTKLFAQKWSMTLKSNTSFSVNWLMA